ncbi:hypothetical protein JIG36_24800 [Actinoplanes sp. LDG1-06]|uniref:Shikimate kinase n=1 Tax=Paractinoplanes ovalisporus TaxID=2810368 RepID=A0ABS2AG25_9ACTN|nr:hypothetical protein [Actinoplanes ovalisporus]MBM2618782.1 hypothetical protein [Actinoplanes ovalisporus]
MADAAGSILTTAGFATAVVDTDALAQFGPPPAPYDEIKCANLAALWATFQAAGARFIVVAAVVDSLARRERYAESLAGCEVVLVRLTAADEVVRDRLRRRDTGARLERHLSALDSRRRLSPEDFAVANDRAPEEVAVEILTGAGWPTGPHQ